VDPDPEFQVNPAPVPDTDSGFDKQKIKKLPLKFISFLFFYQKLLLTYP
jgi:hypothetical protein